MIEMVTSGGKKIGQIADSADGQDTLIIKGKSVSLEDVYQSKELADAFNTQMKELNDASTEDNYTKRFTG